MSDENSFTEQPLENQFDENAFDDPDSFEDGSDEVEVVFPTHDVESRLKGNRVNELYRVWLANPCEQTLDQLLADTINFSRRIIQKKYPSADTDDLAQEAVKKIWRELSRAKQRAEDLSELKIYLSRWFNTDWLNEPPLRFSNWVCTVAINTLKEHWRKSYVKKDVQYSDTKNYQASGGYRRVPQSHPEEQDENGNLLGAKANPTGKQALMTKEELERSETQLNDPIDRDLAVRKLSYKDQELYWMVQDGYEDAELAEHFKTTKQKICNRWNYIRTLIDDALAVPAVIVHTCLPSFQNVYVMEEGLRYVEDESGKSYRTLLKCRCRRALTRLKSRELIKLGEAVHVYKLNSEGTAVVNEPAMVWSSQMPRVPRVGLTSSTHIERAVGGRRQDQEDIRSALEITAASINDLIVPAKDDPWVGRPRFTSWTDQRTVGGRKKSSRDGARKAKDKSEYGTPDYLAAMHREQENKSLNKRFQPGFIKTSELGIKGVGRASEKMSDLADREPA